MGGVAAARTDGVTERLVGGVVGAQVNGIRVDRFGLGGEGQELCDVVTASWPQAWVFGADGARDGAVDVEVDASLLLLSGRGGSG